MLEGYGDILALETSDFLSDVTSENLIERSCFSTCCVKTFWSLAYLQKRALQGLDKVPKNKERDEIRTVLQWLQIDPLGRPTKAIY